MSTLQTEAGLCVEAFSHPDEFPADVSEFFDRGEAENIEFGTAWYRDFVDSIYPNRDGIRIYVLRNQGVPAAALPIRVEKTAFSCRLKSLGNYYTSIYAPLMQADVTSKELGFLLSFIRDAHAPIGEMRFAPMDPRSAAYLILLSALRATGLVTFEFFCFGNWYQPVNADWPTYLASRDGAVRSTIKRMSKKFAAKGGTLELTLLGEDLDRGLAAYESVYAKSWKVPEPYPKFIPALMRTCAKRGWLRLGVAWFRDQPIAAQLWIVANGKANIYKLAYDEEYKSYAPGTLLTAMLMEHAIERDRVAEIDYLIGDDPYKKSWTSNRRERWGIIAFNPKNVMGILGLSRECLSRALKPLITNTRLLAARFSRSTNQGSSALRNSQKT